MTTNVIVSLEVVNHFEFPKEAELLTQELGHMSQRLEEEPDYTEEDELIVHAFEGEYHTLDAAQQMGWVRDTVAELSEDFPHLVLALDVKTDDLDQKEPRVVRREYFSDGKRQVAEPYLVIPDFDPDGRFEAR